MRLEGPQEGGLLLGKGTAADGTKRKVTLDGVVRTLPFKTYWIVEPTRKVTSKPIEMEVTEAGFVPASLEVKAGQPVKLRITRKTDSTCAKDVEVPGHVPTTELPLGKPVEIAFTPSKAGTLRYGCSMGQMIGGVLVVQ